MRTCSHVADHADDFCIGGSLEAAPDAGLNSMADGILSREEAFGQGLVDDHYGRGLKIFS